MVVKISLFNNSMNQSIVLSNDEITIIGRGFFECQDKRVSKKHGEITVLDSTIKIKSCHQNPIFYKIKNDPKKNVLRKDSEVILGDSDRFSLLPEEFEWTIRVEQENKQNDKPTSTFRIRQTDEINANLTQLLREEYEAPDLELLETPDLEGRETPDLERTPSPDNLRPPEGFQYNQGNAFVVQAVSSSSRKRSLDNSGETENIGIKKIKQISSAQVPSSTTSESVQQTTSDSSYVVPQSSDTNNSTLLINIKHDPDSTNMNKPQQNTKDQNISTSSTIKTEPTENNDQQPSSSNADVKVDTSTVKKEDNLNNSSCQQPSVRPSCEFGIRCYRMTDEHRREYAHPMDNDYRRPNFPPAPLNAPRCPYWDSCYRRNPEHFREMAHPSSDSYTSQRPPQIHIQINQVVPPPANQLPNRNRIRNVQNVDDDEDGIFDSDNDMFNDGDDSDVDQDYEIDYSQSTFDDDEDNEYEENNLEE
ncbi:aprataxin and PNK-like factor isoform X2 [Chironomus tepperi]|uniref:aprataxin and PNK-like factor isoform X2 n=1 Tax=Chironomus tepperi TaxID=113505 RepID=UPI00391F407B